MLPVQHADIYTDFNGLAKLKNQARQESPEALKEVAKQFESIFLGMVLKSMREASLGEGIMDSDKTKFYQDMYDQQLSIHLSGDHGIGLADLIIRQLSHDKGVSQDENLTLENYRQNPFPVSRLPEQKQVEQNGETEKINLKDNRDLPIQTSEQFVNQLWPYAEKAAKQLGVEPKVLMAQAALETGWGKSVINSKVRSSFNLFNIKADSSWQGKQVKVSTLEFEQGVAVKKTDGFRSYESYRESFEDYVSFIQNNPRYGEALKHAGEPLKYMQNLQQAGYATDPNYADKVMKILNGRTLSEFSPDRLTAAK